MKSIFTGIYPERKPPVEQKEKKIDYIEIFNFLSEGIIVFNNHGEMIIKNDSIKRLLEISNEDITFNALTNFFNIDISLEELVYIENTQKKEFFVNKNGKYIKLQIIAPFNNENRAEFIIMAISDYSEQKSLDDRRKDFVANVSHELKTPLTSILSYSEALQDDDIDKETRDRFLNVVIEEANRMDRLIGDLLQLSKLSGKQFPLNIRRYPFGVLIKNCVEKIKLDAQNHNLTVNSYIIGDLPEVMMDVDKMEQVILNVLSNAIKYTSEKGVITIYAGANFNQVYAKISDDGIGIPKEYLNRVFERFYRVDKARTRQAGGTGLGLAISKEIVEAHAGIITINSEFGEGTDVMIKIPIKSKKNNENFYE